MPHRSSLMPRQLAKTWTASNILLLITTIAFIVVWLVPLPIHDELLRQYAPLHTMLEMVSVVIAGAIFSAGWHARLARSTDIQSLLAIGFLGVALLDLAHTLSFAGMPDWVTPSGGGKAIYFWFLARYMAAFTLLLFVLSAHARQLRSPRWMDKAALFLVLAIVALSCWLVLFHVDWLPVFLIPDVGLTPFKIYTEWFLAVVVLGVMWLVWRRPQDSHFYEPHSLLAALWLMVMSELCFTLYSDVTDLFNLMGHVYKVLSYTFLYHSLVVAGIRLPYKLLSQSQEVLQQLTDNIRSVFWMSTPDKQTMLYMSPTFESIWQKSRSELAQDPMLWIKAVHPDDAQRVNHYLKQQSSDANEIEYRIVRPDGSVRHIRSRTFPIRNADGDVFRIAGIAEDITDQIMAQQRLLRNERVLQQSQALSHIGTWEYDTENEVLTWSDEVYRIFGLDPKTTKPSEELFNKYIHPDDRAHVDDCYDTSVARGDERYECEHRVVRADNNEVRYVLEKSTHIRDNTGKVIRTIGLIYDITEQKQARQEVASLQSQLMQAQKMEAIGHLTGGIAHDFNNMLGAIIGYAELLKIKFGDVTDDPRQKRYIEEILVASNRAKDLIAQMLVFSRLQPEAEVEDIDVYIDPVVKEVMQLLSLSIPSTIAVHYQIGADTLRAHINPIQLHQIILNLAINARDACGQYGQIDIEITQRHMTGTCDSCHQEYDGEYVVIAVRDTGVGISEDTKAKIFNPFFTTKEVGKGTGMGLSVVHGMVHSHHGHIQVSAREDQRGTVFEILLPLTYSTNETTVGDSQPQLIHDEDGLTGLYIMVIDDEPAVADYVSELLQLHGAQVAAFTNPIDALNTFGKEARDFDLVITDATMPELDGLDLAQRLLRIRPSLPIVLCTGFNNKVNDETVKQAGIARLIYKPVSANDLLTAIKQLTSTAATQGLI